MTQHSANRDNIFSKRNIIFSSIGLILTLFTLLAYFALNSTDYGKANSLAFSQKESTELVSNVKLESLKCFSSFKRRQSILAVVSVSLLLLLVVISIVIHRVYSKRQDPEGKVTLVEENKPLLWGKLAAVIFLGLVIFGLAIIGLKLHKRMESRLKVRPVKKARPVKERKPNPWYEKVMNDWGSIKNIVAEKQQLLKRDNMYYPPTPADAWYWVCQGAVKLNPNTPYSLSQINIALICQNPADDNMIFFVDPETGQFFEGGLMTSKSSHLLSIQSICTDLLSVQEDINIVIETMIEINDELKRIN